MFLLLVILFIGLPIAEIALLIEVGTAFGLLATLAACVVTAVVGAWLARAQGASILRQVQRRLWQGEMPGRELVDGLLVAVAGVLLLTPGFVTDAVGLFILLPPTRLIVRGFVLRHFKARVMGPRPVWVAGDPWAGPAGPRAPWGAAPAERQEQPIIQVLPPVAPQPTKPRPPTVIDDD